MPHHFTNTIFRTMKNIIIFFLFAIAATFASCTKDCPAPSDPITGDWYRDIFPHDRHIFNIDGTVCRQEPEGKRTYSCFLFWYSDATGHYLVDGPKKFKITYESTNVMVLRETGSHFENQFKLIR